ncbi:MAG: hypothetical protein ACLPY1_03600 [Terracidiphilus sp.]
MLSKRIIKEVLPLLLFTLIGFLVMGYHPGFEDDGVYLTAVKADLNPALYPHDSDFFQLQMQATAFDGLMTDFIRWTGMPVAWAELLWQFVALFLILWACRRIASLIFSAARAQWSAVAMVAAMFTLPVAGTALIIADQHLHPRSLATALILFAVSWILEGKRWQAVPLLVLTVLLHPIMAALGISFCVFLTLALREPAPFRLRAAQGSLAAAVPLGWVFAPTSPSWRLAAATRTYVSVYRWSWYEWLGALAPLFLFWLLWRWAQKRGEAPAEKGLLSAECLGGPTSGAQAQVDSAGFLRGLNPPAPCEANSSAACNLRLARFALAVFAYGVFQQIVAMVLMAPDALLRFSLLQPMRYLHLVYIFMALAAGGLLGQFVLKAKAWRWAVYLLVFNGGMFISQWELIDDGAHFEMPWMATSNPWLQAFDWVRLNTPVDAYFALDPRYLAAPGEGFHSFRTLAERSQLADGIKDTAVVIEVPSLAPLWHQQQLAQAGWEHFQLADFERLKAQWGVNWVLVSHSPPSGLDCRWHNDTLAVCQIPPAARPITPSQPASSNPAHRQLSDGEMRAQSSAPSERTRPASAPHLP